MYKNVYDICEGGTPMKHGIRFAALLFVLASLCLLSGCTLGSSVDSLFTLPQLPEEYRELSATLDKLLDEGYAYLTPTEGPNIESVQTVDLDGDGIKEVVALFRYNGDTMPLKVIAFQQSRGQFERFCTIESAGTSLDSINYCDLTGDGEVELLISWRGEDGKKTVSVYRPGRESTPLLESEYSEYIVQDLDGNGIPGLLLLRELRIGIPVAEYYSWQTDIMRLNQSCLIDCEVDALSRGSVVGGKVAGGVPAVFVTGVQGKDTAITDVLLYRNGELLNAVPDGMIYHYCQMAPQDIDDDGITEVPYRSADADDSDSASTKDTLVDWMRYDVSGEAELVAETYHCQSYGWYIRLQEEDWGNITVSNGDIINGENCAEFSRQGTPIGAVYSISCENRESRAQMGDRFIVTRLPGTIYAAEIYEELSPDGKEITALRENFSLIVNTWNSGWEGVER